METPPKDRWKTVGGEKGKGGPRTRKGWIGSEKWVKMTEVERKKIFDERRKQKEEERRKVAKTGRPILHIIMDVGKTVGPAVVISSDPMVDDFCIIMLEWMTIGKAESRFAKWFVENGLDNKPLMYAMKDKRMIAIFEGAVKSLEDTDVIEIQSTPFASVV